MEEAGDGVEDDFGLVEGEAGDGEVVFAAAVVAGVANLEEGVVDDFEGGDEGFTPAVSGDQQVFIAMAVFEPLFLARVRCQAEEPGGEKGDVVESLAEVFDLERGFNFGPPFGLFGYGLWVCMEMGSFRGICG